MAINPRETPIAFQGERGAYSEEAVAKLFGDAPVLPLPTLNDVFAAVSRREVHVGVVPVENSTAGSINDTYDLLLRYDLNICGETQVRVSHCLMALPGEKIESLQKVYSHPQALAQCEEFLGKLRIEVIPSYDTAGSAKMIKEHRLAHCAAVASRRAAGFYDLEILAASIETNPRNYTRFLVISHEEAQRAEKNKTSIIFAANNVPGALYTCMGAFANRKINLTKLESRPSRDRPWEYVFYADFEGHKDDAPCCEALADLRRNNALIKILGSYPAVGE
ncbi:MAG: prephenate dehydratase [Dehalococcoidia bacterium]|nr:prephenate dehydratase [Dehalococcoidia bacterium]